MRLNAIGNLLLLLQIFVSTICLSAETKSQMTQQEMQELNELLKFDSDLISHAVGDYYAARAVSAYGPADLSRAREIYAWWPMDKVNEIYILDRAIESGFGLLTNPNFDRNSGPYARVAPDSKNYSSEVMCMYRDLHDGRTYEYWVIKVWGKADSMRGILFFVTVADALNAPRTLLVADSSYLSDFKVSDDYTLHFPESDLEILYFLKAWLYPDGFADSELDNTEIVIADDGQYIATSYVPASENQEWEPLPTELVKEIFGLRE